MKNHKLKIVFFGTPSFVLPVLQVLRENFDLVGVVTTPDRKVGRKQILTPTPAKKWANEYQIPVFTPDKLDQSVFTMNHELRTIDLFVVASYGKIIPQEILDIPQYGALNIHPSLLPKERGASPIQATILKGEKTSGITIIQMDEKMDHGPVVFTKKISLSDQDTFDSLSKKMFEEIISDLPKIIQDFVSGKIKPKAQNHKAATFNKIIKKEGGFFEIDNPPSPEVFERMVRAYYPWPGVWTRFRQGSSGQAKIVKFLPGGRIQLEGKKAMSIKDFLNGYPDFPLKKLL